MYDWKRFWTLYGNQAYLLNNGLLYDPESASGKAYNPNVFSFDEIRKYNCLLLLGDAGTGKTTALKQEFETSKELNKDDFYINENLISYDEGSIFIEEVFESSDFKSWIGSDKKLFLFLDGLDEGILQLNTIPDILRRKFNKLSEENLDRLFLRITCRSNSFSEKYKDDFEKIWFGKCRTYEIAPLRYKDVQIVLNSKNIDSNEFFDILKANNIEHLTSRPITLNFGCHSK